MKFKKSVLIASIALIGLNSGAYACSANSHISQGMLYANMSDFPNAINEFKSSIKCRKTAKGYSNLGAAYMHVGKMNLALDALKKAEGRNKKDNIVLYNLAAAYSLTDNTDLSLVYLDKALKYGFKNYDALRFDPDLANLRGEPEFRSALEKHKVFIQ